MKQVLAIKVKMMNNPRSVYNLWNDENVDDTQRYFSIQLLMGIISKFYYQMYWSEEILLLGPISLTMMICNRFEYIRKMLHFIDHLGVDHDKPLSRLEAYLKILLTEFRTVYIAEQHIAIDEYLAIWKGRLKFEAYIPGEQEQFGIKTYMLCESHSFQTLLSTMVLTLCILSQVLPCQNPLKTMQILQRLLSVSLKDFTTPDII